jgi:hypothetical protein
MSNLVRRVAYTRSAPPPLDQINIGEGELFLPLTANTIGHILPPHATAADLYTIKAQALKDAADAGTGYFLAWGGGDPAWDDTPEDDVTGETALEDFLGEHTAAGQFVDADPAGTIITANGSKYSAAAGVSKRLYLAAAYATGDEPDQVIREIAAYINAAPAAGHEADAYLPLANLDDIGDFIAQDRIALVPRSDLTSGAIRIVVKIGNT